MPERHGQELDRGQPCSEQDAALAQLGVEAAGSGGGTRSPVAIDDHDVFRSDLVAHRVILAPAAGLRQPG